MGKKLFITEKPSVAMEFKKALGITAGSSDGYIEGEDTVITWCIGHLVTMSYPEKYDESLKQWKMETLPFLPKTFKYEIIDNVRKQFNVVKSLIERNDVDAIYYSGDSAREGEYIQRLVRQFCKIRPEVEERRVWIDSQTKDEILRGIREAKLLSEYDNLSDSGYMRAAEDYLFGINLSRAYSIKYGTLFNNIIDTPKYEPIAVGRVMTCVLGMVVDRERLIKGTKEIPFYGVKGTLENGITTEWKTVEGSEYFESPLLFKSGAFKEKREADELTAKCNSIGTLILSNKEVTEETKGAPLLYNLAELQDDCSNALKISPDKTLEIVQALYEKKLVTYPRTDARVLSSAVAKEIHHNVAGLQKHPKLCAAAVDAANSSKIKNIADTKYTNDKMISDHYAIVPTGQGADTYDSLSQTEKAVYDMICTRFLAIFYPDAVFEKTTCQFMCGNEMFVVSSKTMKKAGFLALYDKEEDTEENFLFKLEEGKTYPAKFITSEGKTTPPKRYTSGSMILAMENAGQLIEDPELRAQIKKSGIGTSATRAETLKKLLANKYICLNEKTQVITPSERGEVIYDIVKAITPSLLKPEMTANWEKGLDMIVSGEVTKEGYLEKLYAYVTREVNSVKDSDFENVKSQLPKEKKQTNASGGFQKKSVKPKFKKEHPVAIPEKCPHCGSKTKEFDWGIVCQSCEMKVPKSFVGVNLTEKQIADLIYGGKTDKIDGFKKKDGSGTFSAKLKVDDDWKIKFDFGK